MATAYTPEKHARMVKALRAGSTFRDACDHAGIAWGTWLSWRRQVERDGVAPADPGIVALVHEAREAHGDATLGLVATVNVAGKKDWRAAMGLMEFRANAAKRSSDQRRAYYEAKIAKQKADGTHVDRTDVTSGGKPLASLTDDDLDARIAALELAAKPDAG